MKLLVVIPTYNEAANIAAMIERVLAVDRDYHVLVVDDNSPDGTAAVVAAKATANPRVRLLRREHERGFGTAIRDGFAEALRTDTPLIGEMDADGSHDPAVYPALIAPIDQGRADLVIGSRYQPGGQIEGFTAFRHANSHVANWLARLFTGVRVADATGGLRVFRREVLEALDLNALLSPGYSVILETNYRAQRAGFRLAEVPITFHRRAAGDSKMGLREITRYLWFLLRLRWQGGTPPPPQPRLPQRSWISDKKVA